MANSKAANLPRKPHPDFPLYPHQSDRWAKKVRGKTRFFGKATTDPQGEAALAEWLRTKDDHLAGRTPRAKSDGLTVADLCNRFLTAKDKQLAAGELSKRMRADYGATTDRIIAAFGKTRLATDLAADDFERLRASIAATGGPQHLSNVIQRVRTVFKYGYEAGLIDRPVRFGPQFKKPSRRTMRLAKAESGQKLFAAGEARILCDAADVHLRAMILLGLNCGFGNNDCGTLPQTALDLDGGWVNYHRPKTGIDRRCPLWPETVAALRASLVKRPAPQEDSAAGLVFVTKYGASWAKDTVDNPVTKALRKLLDATGLHRPGLGFYGLRHTFRTVADEARDQPAANAIMGHADAGMAATYRERIDDARLRAVTDYVRGWLYPPKPTRGKSVKAGGKSTASDKPRKVKPRTPTVLSRSQGSMVLELFVGYELNASTACDDNHID